jgi:hypothetical protein
VGSWPGGGGAGGLEGHRKLGQGVWGSRAARGSVDIHWGGVGGVWGRGQLAVRHERVEAHPRRPARTARSRGRGACAVLRAHGRR